MPDKSVRLSLTARGLANVLGLVDGFTFHVPGTQQTFSVPVLIAAFLSPRISRLRISDPTLLEFHFQKSYSADLIESVLSLGRGQSADFFRADAALLFSLLAELMNGELFGAALGGPWVDRASAVQRMRLASDAARRTQGRLSGSRATWTLFWSRGIRR
jgi:hypothetical protein